MSSNAPNYRLVRTNLKNRTPCLVDSSQSNDWLTVYKLSLGYPYVSPLHHHMIDDEIFYILNGEWNFELQETVYHKLETIRMKKHDLIHCPPYSIRCFGPVKSSNNPIILGNKYIYFTLFGYISIFINSY